MHLSQIHHLTFVVRDLEQSIHGYQVDLGVASVEREELPGRGVRTARFRIGEVWIVLAQPIDDGEPMRYLREHGEGLLLISYQVADLEGAIADSAARGGPELKAPRVGLAGWRVVDIAASVTPGVITQLCEALA